jgi:hypothetical protein
MVVNFVQKNSITFVLNMESKDSSLHPTLHNRMEWLRGETILSQRWPKCMMENRCVPNRFWAEVVFTVVYLLNRSPMMVVKQKTPEEAWSGRKPRVNHLKVFGSTTYAWIPDEKRTKLDPKRKKLMITGYNDSHKAYRLVDVDTNQLSFNRDVIVDEEVGPFQTSLEIKITEQQLVLAKDSGIKLQAAPPERGEDSEHEEFLGSDFDDTI